jgi:hypothetical protein
MLELRPVAAGTICSKKMQEELTPAGLPRPCTRQATMTINGKPACDTCAAVRMAEECGRPTTIKRQ